MESALNLEKSVYDDMANAFCDPSHPAFHLTAPAHFTIDFWGPAIKDGYYHIFYHVCPQKGDIQDETVFFHSRSKNLIDWEMLGIPIAPLEDEVRMNDGCICFDGNGRPVMMYTKVPKNREIPRTHCAAYGDKDLNFFTRIDGNPFMSPDNHGGPDFRPEWSDPFVFNAEGRSFLLVSKCVTRDGKNLMPIYEATDDSMLNWEYKGIFFENNGEVVNFLRLGDKWVLIYSPYDTIEYFVGDFDTDTLRFIPEYNGKLCYGYHTQNDPVDRGFYASFVYEEEHRKIISGWISGFSYNEYWNGCMGIPREIGLNNSLQVTQKPIQEFDSLREAIIMHESNSSRAEFEGSDMMDIELEYENELLLKVESRLCIKVFDGGFFVNEEKYLCDMPKDKKLRLLIDKSVAEIFFGDGSVTATRCFEYIGKAPLVSLSGKIKKLFAYKIKPCDIKKQCR